VTGPPSLLHYSPSESARFRLRVFRGHAKTIDAQSLRHAIAAECVDVAIVRVPVQPPDALERLAREGLNPMIADTLVHYEVDLRDRVASIPRDSRVRLRPAEVADADRLESMAREVFTGYASHYSANPLFSAADILDGYADWAARHVRSPGDREAAWVVEAEARQVGFSCYRIEHFGNAAIGVLNGVLPEARGRGVYRDMLRQMLIEFGERGAHRFAISTQAHNAVVQRVWIDEGLCLTRTENTIHFNAHHAGRPSTGSSSRDRSR
jgi:GNAT superfamily N-acetyltransferase